MRSFRGTMWALLLGVSIGFGAVSADAKNVYRWETDEGVVSFADELKRVPEHYRAKVDTIDTTTLSSAKRFTVVAEPARAGHADQVAARLERLRVVNESEAGAIPALSPRVRAEVPTTTVAAAGPTRFLPQVVDDPHPLDIRYPQNFLTTGQAKELIALGRLNRSGLRLGSSDSDPVYRRRSGTGTPDVVPNLNFSPDPNSDEPVVVEKKRVRTAGAVTTQTVTVVRQGDKILGVIKPRANSHSAQSWAEDPY